MTTTMKRFVVLWPLLSVLLSACGTHQPTAECSRFFSAMRKAFERYDRNNDGLISRQEYHAVINHLLGSGDGRAMRREDPDKDDQDFDSFDRNRDGYLAFDEFTGNKCEDGH
jgi:Ca2+-binding EF-hand superfamily protein